MSLTFEILILSRVIQAIGGSMMVPVSRLAILYTYSKDKLLGVMNMITIPGLIGPVVGPTLGGLLVDVASWHWNFLINIPIGIAGMVIAHKYMPDYKNTVKKFDLMGMVLFGGSLILITLAIEFGTENILNGWFLIGIFVMGAILMDLYYRHFRKVSNPLINLNIIKIRTLRISVFANLLTRLGIGGMPLLLPLLFQVAFKHSAMVSGMMLIPMAITNIIIKPLIVPVVKKIGYKKTLIFNTLIIGIVIILFAIPNQSTPLPMLIPLLILFGATNSIQMTTMNTLALSEVLPAKQKKTAV